jgi:ABC-type sugar transport system ATPase subunit
MIVIFASTELQELLDLGDVIVTMRRGRTIATYDAGADGATLMRDMIHGAQVA